MKKVTDLKKEIETKIIFLNPIIYYSDLIMIWLQRLIINPQKDNNKTHTTRTQIIKMSLVIMKKDFL